MWTLAAAHVATASLTVFVLAQVGRLVSATVPDPVLAVALVTVAVAGVAVDIVAIRRAGYSVGPSRQTAKHLAHRNDQPWLTSLLWGADTGIIGTTFRVSFTSWVLLSAAVLGVAPVWAGLVYGVFFAVPLVVSVHVGDRGHGALLSTKHRWFTGLRTAQLMGVLGMLGAPAVFWGMMR